MDRLHKIILIVAVILMAGFSSNTCRGQFFWLGFQGGAGVTWFSHPVQDSTLLSAGAGASFGFFVRYGTRPYYQAGVEWLFSTNQMKFEVKPGNSAHDNIPFHNFKMPVTVGYEIIHNPRFKWRVGGGMFIGTTALLSSNKFDLKEDDVSNPQYGIIGESGIQYLNFLLLAEYNYCFNRFFSKHAAPHWEEMNAHLQVFAVKIGMQF